MAAIGTMLATVGTAGAALGNVSSASTLTPYDEAGVSDLNALARAIGSRDLWACGFTGAGVDVALIDTGVTPVPGSGAVYNGPDLSFDAQTPGGTRSLDAYGHGTHLASLINGRDPSAAVSGACRSATANPNRATIAANTPSASAFAGMATGARVVNLKAGAADGAVDVTQVIAQIDWATQSRNRYGLNIRVLAIPYGVSADAACDLNGRSRTKEAECVRVDPLSHAVTQAVKAGIVVVAAAGNDGNPNKVDLAFPARNPDVVTVGAADPAVQTNPANWTNVASWTVASFSDRGDTKTRASDVFVPAVSVPGLRVPGSLLDTSTTSQGNRLIRGSGTSQATAIVAGVAAQLVHRYPTATPEAIKQLLRTNTWAITAGKKTTGQALVANKVIRAALPTAAVTTTATDGSASVQTLRSEGSIELGGAVLAGNVDVQGGALTAWATASANLTSWSGGSWMGRVYTGTPTSTGVPAAPWASSWAGVPWSQVAGFAGTWDGLRWKGDDWSGLRWKGETWSGLRWKGVAWDGLRWKGTNWDGLRWKGSANWSSE
ncbi:MAG: S8 family serine peptidase, partial [Acidimicrobiales bacterium]